MTAATAVLPFPAEAYVYVLGSDDGPQKIGITKNLSRRLAGIQIGNPNQLSISFSIDVSMRESRDVEAYAHNLLDAFHARGEWFSVSPAEARAALLEAVVAVRAGKIWPRPAGGRPLLYPDKVVAPLREGTKARIRDVLRHGEDTTDFLRTAVESELTRREASAGETGGEG